MNAPLYPEKLLLVAQDDQASLALSTQGIQRYVWESRFGAMLIEVIDGQSFVNGRLVEVPPAEADTKEQPPPLV